MEAEFEIISEPKEVYEIKNLVHKEEVYKIISCCFNVHNTLGKGFLEVIYKDALIHEFKSSGIHYEREKKYEIEYKKIILPHYDFADFLVFNSIILEVKAQAGVVDEH